MATFREQKEFVDGLRIREGETRRINCPFCNGNKTFTADRVEGKLYWNCYKASCPTKGTIDTEMSERTIRNRLDNTSERTPARRTVPIPEILSRVTSHERAMNYLRSVNCIYAVENDLIKVKYAPAEDRVVFFNKEGTGCVGRSLAGAKPKWKLFGEIDGIMQVGTGRTAVVVEDVASACAVSMFSNCSGCAILGTHATTLARRQLRHFDQVVIALDKDASRKALKLKSQLEGRVPTKVVFLERDLKYASREELERLI